MGRRKKVFLKANWERLISANYVVDPSALKKHLPVGTVLEPHQNMYFVSLVAFRYSRTRLYNVRVPFHSTFEEVNLRFYVKREITPGNWRSEVAFTKLFFPKKTLSFVANKIYKENYETLQMRHHWQDQESTMHTSYGLNKNGWNNLEVTSEKTSRLILPDSPEFFFTKHYWGTSQIDQRKCTVYDIEHPEWEAYNVQQALIDFDFGAVFGEEFKSLSNTTPESVHLIKGSEVTVNKKRIL